MARLPVVTPEEAPPELHAALRVAAERLPTFMNQIQTLAHRPSIARNLVQLYLGFQDDSVVERRLIELAVLVVSHLNACQYCITHHPPLGVRFGLRPEQLADLTAGVWEDSPHFDATEKLVMSYAKAVTQDARRVPDVLFEQLRAVFDDAQIVELTVRIALCSFFNRFNDALRLDIEPDAVEAYLAATANRREEPR